MNPVMMDPKIDMTCNVIHHSSIRIFLIVRNFVLQKNKILWGFQKKWGSPLIMVALNLCADSKNGCCDFFFHLG